MLPLLGIDSRPSENEDGVGVEGGRAGEQEVGWNEGEPRWARDGEPEGGSAGDAVWVGNGDSLCLLGGRGSSLKLGDSTCFPRKPPALNLKGGVEV